MSHEGTAGDARLPPTVGRYRILTRLAQDTVGEILKGFDPLIERPVVVKVFHVALPDSETTRGVADLFYHEMQHTGVLVHPGIVPLFDAGECPSGLFMASEFVEGGNLAELLARPGECDLGQSMALVGQIVDALEYAHGQGVAHLHLKPTNVMVTSDAVVKVAGFGAAPVIDAITAMSGAGRPSASRSLSPERAAGQSGDHRSDVFSLATLVLDLIAGAGSAGAPAVTPPLPDALAARGIDAARWKALFDRALAADPDVRYASVRTLYQELLLLIGIDVPEPRPVWETFGPVGATALDADSMDTSTAIRAGLGHDARTIEIGGTPRPVDETLAADSKRRRD